jgi:CRISPR-associated protein Csh2
MIIRQRSELLFLYDVTDCNPNGDPQNDNRPRQDSDGRCLVTDVRLKRTVRDFLYHYRKREIFVREVVGDNGLLLTREQLLEEIDWNLETLITRFDDLRLFGATITIGKGKKPGAPAGDEDRAKGSSIKIIGPVQFRLGRSMHRITVAEIPGTASLPARQERLRGTMIMTYLVPYALIAFYGTINEHNAAIHRQLGIATPIGLTEEDVTRLLEGLWLGTKHLMTRSKTTHMPRLLLRVIYRPDDLFFIGALDHLLGLVNRTQKPEEDIRSVSEVQVDVTALAAALEAYRPHLAGVQYGHDPALQLVRHGRRVSVPEIVPAGIPVEELPFASATPRSSL